MFKKLFVLLAVGIIGFALWMAFVQPGLVRVIVNEAEPSYADSRVTVERSISSNRENIKGDIKIIESTQETYLRLENYELKRAFPACSHIELMLTEDREISGALSLGKLRGTEGSMNYSLTEDQLSQKFNYVTFYCKTFRSEYGYAQIK